MPDPDSLHPAAVEAEVGWVAADCMMDGKPVEQAPRDVLKRLIAEAAEARLRDARPASSASSS